MNVRTLRQRYGWTLDDVSRRLAEVGRPLATSGVGKIEDGTRRVDVDDLTALAEVFDVDPERILGWEPAVDRAVSRALRAVTATEWRKLGHTMAGFVAQKVAEHAAEGGED